MSALRTFGSRLRQLAECSSLRTALLQDASAANWLCKSRPLSSASAPPKSPLNFGNSEIVFAGQSNLALLRSVAVFYACSFPWFVKSAPQLLGLSKSVLGEKLTMRLVKHTFYAQFCAGEDEKELKVTTSSLQSRGIGGILDYAAEDDLPEGQAPLKAAPGHKATNISTSMPTSVSGVEPVSSSVTGQVILPPGPAVARQYPYTTELQCDAHVETFLSCIGSASRNPGGRGFAAVKLTALGNPTLLERVSTAIKEVHGLFKRWDKDGNGFICRDEFHEAYKMLIPDATERERENAFKWMDAQKQGKVDWVAWCQRLSLSKMPEYAARIAQTGGDDAEQAMRTSLRLAALTPEEVSLVWAIRGRLAKLARAAAQSGVRLLIDAEHTYFQPAIDHLTMELMRKYNAHGPAVIYNTYQAYLHDSESRLTVDQERARRDGYTLGAKLVRGAYMEIERSRAAERGYTSPVWDTVQDTHDSYNRCLQLLLHKVKEGRAEVMLGTHNQGSIELAVAEMSALGLDPKNSHVYFGQLLGMADHLTQTLGQSGYNAYKYVPYGKVDQVIPYLLRRARENASIMQGSKQDVALLKAEIVRRVRVMIGLVEAPTKTKQPAPTTVV